MKKGMYEENGINLSKTAPRVGDRVDISYKGLLKQSGASNVKLHLGYNDTWEDSQYIEMNLSGDIFMATVPVQKEGMLNFAFMDPVGNWDNNSGFNYSISIIGNRTAKEVSPMTGPYDKRTAARKTAKAGSAKTEEEAAAPTKKTVGETASKITRETASKTTGETASKATGESASKTTRRKAASAPGPDTPLDTMTGGRGQGPAVPIMPEKTAGTAKRGPGRKKKEQ